MTESAIYRAYLRIIQVDCSIFGRYSRKLWYPPNAIHAGWKPALPVPLLRSKSYVNTVLNFSISHRLSNANCIDIERKLHGHRTQTASAANANDDWMATYTE